MKSHFWRIVICVTPVILSCWIVYHAWVNDLFKWGVDLKGGTILVYEIDTRKMQQKEEKQKGKEEAGPQSNVEYFKQTTGKLAEALKRRIDPTGTYNIVIRPAGGEGRVEIILPTGGEKRARKAEEAWQQLLKNMEKKWSVENLAVPRGNVQALVDDIQSQRSRELWRKKLFQSLKPTTNGVASVIGVGLSPYSSLPFITSYRAYGVEDAWNRLVRTTYDTSVNPDAWRSLSIVKPTRNGAVSLVGLTGGQNPILNFLTTYRAYGSPADRLKKIPNGDIDKLVEVLGESLTTNNPGLIESWIKQEAWKELIRRAVMKWPELKDQEKVMLEKIPADSFRELVGRIETKGNVISQAALDVVEPLIGRDSSPKDLIPRKEIEEFIIENYGPPDYLIRESVANLDEEMGRSKDLTIEEIQKIKDRISKVGALEFRILANQTDDALAIKEIQKLINDAAKSGDEILEKAAIKGEPPPVTMDYENPDVPRMYTIKLPRGVKSVVTYSWAELGKQERAALGFDNASRTSANKRRRDIWFTMHKADGQAIQIPDPATKKNLWQGALFYRRECIDRTLPEKERREKKYEYFVLTRNPEIVDGKQTPRITGDYLVSASTDTTQGRPAVAFTFNTQGGDLFGNLTRKNRPSGAGAEESKIKRHLAIILDGLVISAPTINSEIRTRGQITGDFTKRQVDEMVSILRSGALPATLKPQPVSESTIGATLGRDTIRAGVTSIGWAFVVVLAFMVIYYRFAGLVACIALFANLALTVGFMVLVQATFTLPGLAGLVLMLGMAVDANVLIYERLREERDRGASLALALRNGYERAFPTIIDTHLSSIFTAVVLYAVGNDQLKGFGISLTVGLIISLFTSLFMTRTIFNLWLDRGWLKKLAMFRLLSKPNINFMGVRHLVFSISVGITIAGLAFFLGRIPNDLNIDFKGGTAFSAQLKEGYAQDIQDLRRLLGEKSQEKHLNVSRVLEVEGSDQRKYEVFFLHPDTGKEELPKTVILANRPDFETVEERQEDVKTRLSQLPDWSVEQIFPSFAKEEDPTKSRFLTVRTSEMERDLVQLMLGRLLRTKNEKTGNWDPLLRQVGMDFDAGRITTSKRSIELNFFDPDTKEKDYASLPYVKTVFHNHLREEFKLKDGKLAFQYDLVGQGKSKEGRFSEMSIRFEGDLEDDQVSKIKKAIAASREEFLTRPQPERLENFDSELAANQRFRALGAILASWLAVVLYLWFRFGNWTFGLAAVLCLIHDLCFVLGLVAISAFIQATPIGPWLQIDDFKLDLTAVAALLTLVGYSVADTIVVFDRIREVRGKNPALTATMINDSVNQTLSRTLLTSGTTFVVVAVLYWFGGPGIHLFSFIMVAGVLVGTFSSIYIASPLLLMFGEGKQHEKIRETRRETVPATT